MWANWENSPEKHFYVCEVAQLTDGRFVLPLRFVIFEKTENVEAKLLTRAKVRVV